MDKVYTLTMRVRYEGDTLMGIYKTREGAEEAAMKYMEGSCYSWTPDDLTGRLPQVWNSNLDADLWICDEDLLP